MPYNASTNSTVGPMVPPCTKTAYRRREDADEKIRQFQVTGYTKVLHSYQCPECDQWHIISSP